MNKNYAEHIPVSFTLNRRSHSISGWMELLHELIEDLFISGDPDGEKIKGITVPGTDKQIVCAGAYPGKCIVLSNGLLIPADYSEQEYALSCRTVCIVYGITPLEMSIRYREAAYAVVPDIEPEDNTAAEPECEATTVDDTAINETEVKEPESEAGEKIQSPISVNVFDLPKKRTHKLFSEAEEMWSRLMQKDSEQTPSDVITITKYDDNHQETEDELDWDSIIDRLDDDRQASAAAKLMKKAGIRPPSVMNFRGIKAYNKVGGEALFLRAEEKTVYLHGMQKYSKGYFLERHFEHILTDDP